MLQWLEQPARGALVQARRAGARRAFRSAFLVRHSRCRDWRCAAHGTGARSTWVGGSDDGQRQPCTPLSSIPCCRWGTPHAPQWRRLAGQIGEREANVKAKAPIKREIVALVRFPDKPAVIVDHTVQAPSQEKSATSLDPDAADQPQGPGDNNGAWRDEPVARRQWLERLPTDAANWSLGQTPALDAAAGGCRAAIVPAPTITQLPGTRFPSIPVLPVTPDVATGWQKPASIAIHAQPDCRRSSATVGPGRRPAPASRPAPKYPGIQQVE
jgi:hypothetical protein